MPPWDIDNPAGITTILEVMSMDKAVIVSQSPGQTDVVEDRRSPGSGIPRPASLVRMLAADRALTVEPERLLRAAGAIQGVREAIISLLAHPELRRRLGVAGRRITLELLSVDEFASRLQQVIYSACEAAPAASIRPIELGKRMTIALSIAVLALTALGALLASIAFI